MTATMNFLVVQIVNYVSTAFGFSIPMMTSMQKVFERVQGISPLKCALRRTFLGSVFAFHQHRGQWMWIKTVLNTKKDVTNDKYCFTDGIGLISPHLAKRV